MEMKEFKKTITGLVIKINLPYQRISFGTDKWGFKATVYFHDKKMISLITGDLTEDELDYFPESFRVNSNAMVCELKKCYGDNFRKYIKVIN